MNVLAVMVRELRVQGRQPFTYLVRGLGVLALLVGGLLWTNRDGLLPMQGSELFVRLHWVLFVAVWVLVPLGAADCLSRERREGTLPLLLLAALRPAEIVVAKSLAHGLRALTLLVAVAPVLTIPFLVGGIGWGQVAFSVAMNTASVVWALALALAVSAVHSSAVRAQAMAMLLAAVALLTFIGSAGWLMAARQGAGSDRSWELGFWLVTGLFGQRGVGVKAAAGTAWAMLGLGVLLWVAAWIWAAAFVRRVGQEPPPWVVRAERSLCTPRIGAALLRGWLRRMLERNPIGWLERRRWQGRLLAWAWIAVLATIYSYVVAEDFNVHQMPRIQRMLGWLLVGSMAASAAGSFRRERETGMLELLLVSPLTVGQIVGGRLRGLWGQFLPAFALWAGVGLYWMTSMGLPLAGVVGVGMYQFFRLSWEFLLVPVVGLYFSLRCRSFLVAFVLTVATGMVVPRALPRLAWAVLPLRDAPDLAAIAWTLSPLGQVLVAGWAGLRLVRGLVRREFALQG